MLDIKVIRENPERVKAAVKSRNGNLDAEVDELIAIDAERRALQQENDKLKQQQNEASKQIPQIKKAGGDASEIFAKMGEIKTQVKANDEKLASLADRQKQIVLGIDPPYCFHALRHYSASYLHAQGIPDAYIMARGGWATPAVMQKVYRHALKDKVAGMEEKAVAAFQFPFQSE